MDMLAVGSRSALFGYKVNASTGKVLSKGAGPGGSALTVAQARSQACLLNISVYISVYIQSMFSVKFSLY